MARRRVKYAKTHAEIFVPTIGTFKNTLPPDNKTIKGFKMWRTELGGLLVEAIGLNGTLEFTEIPAGNLAFMVLGDVEDEENNKGK